MEAWPSVPGLSPVSGDLRSLSPRGAQTAQAVTQQPGLGETLRWLAGLRSTALLLTDVRAPW